MQQRLSLEQWAVIFKNLQEMTEEERFEDSDWVEIIYLDSSDHWILCYGYELFEDGFDTEQEALDRLHWLENQLL